MGQKLTTMLSHASLISCAVKFWRSSHPSWFVTDPFKYWIGTPRKRLTRSLSAESSAGWLTRSERYVGAANALTTLGRGVEVITRHACVVWALGRVRDV